MNLLILSSTGLAWELAEVAAAQGSNVRLYIDTDTPIARPVAANYHEVESWRPHTRWADLVVATDFNSKFLTIGRSSLTTVGVPTFSAPVREFGRFLFQKGIPNNRGAEPRATVVCNISRSAIGRATNLRGKRPRFIRRCEPYMRKIAEELWSCGFTGCLGVTFTSLWGHPLVCDFSTDMGYGLLAEQAQKHNIRVDHLLYRLCEHRTSGKLRMASA